MNSFCSWENYSLTSKCMKILDVSNQQILHTDNTEHYSEEINQLYRPCGDSKCIQDGYHLVFSGDSNINETKFSAILVKEWFYLVQKNGYLVIDYIPNDPLKPLDLEDELWLQWWGKYDIIEHQCLANTYEEDIEKYLDNALENYSSTEDIGFDNFNDPLLLSRKWRIVIRKNISTLVPNDTINKWTFGIITNGVRNDWIEELIQSIKDQNIPEYEIIICWNYPVQRPEENFRYIPFNKRSSLGWITKKKNLITQSANFENIIIVHDRYVFDKGWFSGMKKWGNNFDFLTCKQKIKWDKESAYWWERHAVIHMKEIWHSVFRNQISFLSCALVAEDFTKNCYFSGWLVIFKKSINALFDDTLFWCNWEDVELSKRMNEEGKYLRFNKYSSVSSQKYKESEWIQIDWPRIKYYPNLKTPKIVNYGIIKRLYHYVSKFKDRKWFHLIIHMLQKIYHKTGLIKKIKF